jgi:hypothetical protein
VWQEHKVHQIDEQICALARENVLELLLQGTTAITMPLMGAYVGNDDLERMGVMYW